MKLLYKSFIFGNAKDTVQYHFFEVKHRKINSQVILCFYKKYRFKILSSKTDQF